MTTNQTLMAERDVKIIIRPTELDGGIPLLPLRVLYHLLRRAAQPNKSLDASSGSVIRN